MTQIIVDPAMFNKLNRLVEPLELCDASGKILARVVPSTYGDEYEPSQPQVSDAELRRRAQSTEAGSSTADMLSRLEKL